MFIWKSRKLIEELTELIRKDVETRTEKALSMVKEKSRLEEEVQKLKEQVEDLKLKKKISEEDIKHMVKIQQEKNDIEHQRKLMNAESEKQIAIAKVKDDYRDKTEKQLEKRGEEIKDMYGQILERLPNVNMEIIKDNSRRKK